MWRWILAALVLASTAPYIRYLIDWWTANEPAMVAFSWMMPIVAAVGCWIRLRSRADGPGERPAPSWLPALLAVLSLGCALCGWLASEPIVSALGLWLALPAALGMARGPRSGLRYLLPISPLVLTAPLTRDFPELVEGWLQRASAVVGAGWARLFGLDVERDGLLLMTDKFHTLVDETCSGINTLTALAVYSLLLGLILRVRDRNIALVAILSLPGSIVLNGLRIAWIAALGERGGAELAMGYMHGVAGFASFFVGYGLLLLGLVLLRERPAATVSHDDDQE